MYLQIKNAFGIKFLIYAFCILFMGGLSAIPKQPKALFTTVVDTNSVNVPFDSASSRQTVIGVNTAMFEGYRSPASQAADLPNSIKIDLFGNSVNATLDRIEHASKNSVSWIGQIGNDNADRIVLVVEDSIAQGNITYKNEQYQIRYVGGNGDNAIHVLKLIDASKIPPEHPPEFPSGVLDDSSSNGNHNHNHDHNNNLALDQLAEPDPLADSGSIMDVMVVWTAAARTAAGGTSAMNVLVDLAVTETNDGYSNSGVTPRINLVHKQEVTYTEVGFSTDLSRLKNKTDGFLDDVHTLRDTYKADMVGLLIDDSQYCGLAGGIDVDEEDAFHVTAWTCATGYYSFAHEFGHLQAARHDWRTDTTNNSPYTYNHGHFNDGSASWRTIMSYSVCTGTGNCPRLNYWSNPNVTYGGVAMGIPEGTSQAADNRKTLNNTANKIANFRQSESPPIATTLISPAGTIADTTPTFTWDAVSDSTWYELYVNDSTGHKYSTWYTAWQAGCTSGTGTCSITPTTELASGAGLWYVRTNNSFGNGPWTLGLSFDISVSPPVATTLISPAGTITDTTPTFTWNAVSNSTWYELYVNDSTGHRYSIWYTAWQAGCTSGTGTCSITPTTELELGAGIWYVRTNNSFGNGPWTSAQAFEITAGPPDATTLISPTGSISDTTPTFTWNAVSNSTWYELYVNDSTGHRYSTWYTAWQAGCVSGTGTCSITPSIELEAGAGLWYVRTYNSYGNGSWSSSMAFDISTAVSCIFNEPFSTTPTNWAQDSGAWSVSSTSWYSEGQVTESSLSSYTAGDCDNVDVTTRFWRASASGNDGNSNRIIFRGSGAIAEGHFFNEYMFQYSSNGSYSIWKRVDGASIAVQNWTTTSAVNQGAGWNTLRITADGSNFMYYINGTLVWSGIDTSHSTGKLGVGFYSGDGGTANKLWVDYVNVAIAPDLSQDQNNTAVMVIDDDQQTSSGTEDVAD